MLSILAFSSNLKPKNIKPWNGIQLGVNPNTIMRSYETMTAAGIIYNKRGIGYFISPEAKDIVLKQMREEFLEKELPEVIKKMKLLGIGIEEIKF